MNPSADMQSPSSLTRAGGFTPSGAGRSNLVESGIAGVHFTRLGLNIAPGYKPDEAAFRAIYMKVIPLVRASNWLLGDALVLGDRTWGNGYVESKYAEACELTGLSGSTLRHIKKTCELFPFEARHPGLSFAHHTEVAFDTCTPEDRAALLQMASDNKLSSKAMRAAVQKYKQDKQLLSEQIEACPNDDRPFGLFDLPTQEDAKNALPIGFELRKVIYWLENHRFESLCPEHREELCRLLSSHKDLLLPFMDMNTST